MSESTVPPPVAANAEHDVPTDPAIASTSDLGSQTILDTSSSTIPPAGDSQGANRQKRKRTSARDQQILEAEFKRNPRPDKVERLDLVSRVGLTDKEVQVWFQNRRQSSRRRSRPSDGTELMLLSASQDDLDNANASGAADAQHLAGQSFFDLSFDADIPSSSAPAMLVSTPAVTKSKVAEDFKSASSLDSRPAPQRAQSFEDSPLTKLLQTSSFTSTSGTPAFTKTPSLPKSGSFTAGERGYIADRRSAAARSISNGFALPPATPVASSVPSPAAIGTGETRSLKRSRSYLRITMDDDGHAQLIDRAVKSPSPKKFVDAEAQSANLRRSRHAVESDHPDISELFSKKIPRTTAMGRSRDSRAWEFWCDSDARNSLASKADQELNGSAVGAIGQIVASNRALRAQSRRSLHAGSNRLSGNFHKSNRVPLARSRTSNGRLQSMGLNTPKLKLVNTKGKGVEEQQQLITDSDKENWTPTTEGGTPFDSRRNSYFNAPSGTVDRGSPLRKGQFSRPGTAETLDENAVNSRSKEGTPEGDDAEIANFMRGGNGGGNSRASSHSATSSGEDLECVQSLLTLSQGNWR